MEQGRNAKALAGYGINMIVNPVSEGSGAAGVYDVDAIEDEADMWAGPGDGKWTGNFPGEGPICSTNTGCGFTVMQSHQGKVTPGTMRYANYGKGVAFWQSDSDAKRFMNTYQDVTSIDLYWGTDADLCQASQGGDLLRTRAALSASECRKPSNYGATVDRARDVVANSKPIWNYVELGHPGSQGGTMPVSKIRPAVWSSLIHEARGIVYFNHSFGGACATQHVLQDCNPEIAAAVRRTNVEIKTLAPALNSPKVNGVTKTGSIDQLTKFDGKALWIFTGSTKAEGSTSGTVTVPGGLDAKVEVIGESRTVSMIDGKVSDQWADPNTVHLYKVVVSG